MELMGTTTVFGAFARLLNQAVRSIRGRRAPAGPHLEARLEKRAQGSCSRWLTPAAVTSSGSHPVIF